MKALLLVKKDLRVLARSPVLLIGLLAYPLVIAALVGAVAGYANSKPRVALVDEDGLPATVEVGGQRFHVDRTIDRASRNVNLVELSREEANRQLRAGKVVATLTVPAGFIADLKGMVRSPTVELRTTQGGLSLRVTQQVQALVYALNRQLQDAYIEANLEYVDLIQHGGTGDFLGREFELLGLDDTERMLEQLPRGPRLDAIREFVGNARVALDETDEALQATANPIELRYASERGRTWALSAQVQAYGLALTIAFLALVLAAGALAAERDENVLSRLVRGLVSRSELLAAKILLAALLAAVVGTAIAVAFGVIVEIGEITGGQPWTRLPLLTVGLLLAGASLGALGALLGVLAREARTATLAAILVVLPVVFVGLVPREVVPVAGYVSDALPFAHAVRFFGSALFDESPWALLAREALWLVGIGAVFAALARLRMRTLVA